jgi:hypothetical protein
MSQKRGPDANWSIVGNQYGYGEDALGIPTRTRYHTDDSLQYRYYNRPTSFISMAAATLTGNASCEREEGLSGRKSLEHLDGL